MSKENQDNNMSESSLPTKPISGSWLEDTRALLAMGARSIDRATVVGLIEELQAQKCVCQRLVLDEPFQDEE